MAPTPLLDSFKRGDAARDVRLLAAQGALTPHAAEQLEILVLLLDDPDPEIKQIAERTLSQIPPEALRAFLARADAPAALRDFFASRGVVAADTPAAESTDPLVNIADPELDLPDDHVEPDRESVVQRIARMGFTGQCNGSPMRRPKNGRGAASVRGHDRFRSRSSSTRGVR